MGGVSGCDVDGGVRVGRSGDVLEIRRYFEDY